MSITRAQIEAAVWEVLTEWRAEMHDNVKHSLARRVAERMGHFMDQPTAAPTAAAEVGEPYKDGDPLVTELIWEVDRAVKQAMRDGGKYETVIRHILNKHLIAAAEVDTQIRDCDDGDMDVPQGQQTAGKDACFVTSGHTVTGI